MTSNFFWSSCLWLCSQYLSQCEKCPNTEIFLVRIFLHSVRTQENTDQKKILYWDTFNAVSFWLNRVHVSSQHCIVGIQMFMSLKLLIVLYLFLSSVAIFLFKFSCLRRSKYNFLAVDTATL